MAKPIYQWSNKWDNGTALPIEAIQIHLTGDLAQRYDVYYRTHVSSLGWLGWAKNGASSGTQGQLLAAEAFEVALFQKNKGVLLNENNHFISTTVKPTLSYQTHVQNIGWQSAVAEGQLAGTTGRALQVEAINIFLSSTQQGNMEYKTHVENVGWQTYVPSGRTSGSIGKNQQLEAIQIRLTGELDNRYSVKYRVHVENIGWQDWAYDSQMAGTVGQAKAIEAIEILLVDKIQLPTGTSASQGNYKVLNQIIYLDSGHGGTDPGAVYYNQTEKALNLKMQALVKDKLEKAGYRVITTRTGDDSASLIDCSIAANKSLSDIFVSIHFNASTNSAANGIETYYYEYYEDYPAQVNGTYHNNSERLTRSSYLAQAIQAATVMQSKAKNNGVLRNTFSVLRETTAPAVLLELGYMSNAREFAAITSGAYQEKLAQGIVSGILTYYRQFSL